MWYTVSMPRRSSATNAAERAATNVKRLVGENIKTFRIAAGMSQEELAEKFGVSRAALSQYELGAGEVNAGDLPRLASLLGITTLDFFQKPPEDNYAPPGKRGREWMIVKATQSHAAKAEERQIQFDPERQIGTAPASWPANSHAMDQALAETVSQFLELSAADQEIVRRMISALHEKQSPPRPESSANRAGRSTPARFQEALSPGGRTLLGRRASAKAVG